MTIASRVPVDAVPNETALAQSEEERDDSRGMLTDLVQPRGQVIITTSDACGLVIEPVYFEQDSTMVGPSQVRAVDAIAQMLTCIAKEGTLLRIAVQGHADPSERWPDDHSTGTAAGRARHRRVDFLILERKAAP